MVSCELSFEGSVLASVLPDSPQYFNQDIPGSKFQLFFQIWIIIIIEWFFLTLGQNNFWNKFVNPVFFPKKSIWNGFRIFVKCVIFFACLYVQPYQVIWACLDCKHDKFDERRYGKKKMQNVHFCSKASAWLIIWWN